MKQTYHLCLSGNDEIMFRDEEDYHRGFNCFALALYETGSTGLAEAIMGTHTHQVVQTEHPKDHVHYFRRSYSTYFNHKYQRSGKLGEKTHFTMEVVGYHHLLAALSYTLRNPLHHGIVPIPFAYPHCSANAFFRKEMGKLHVEKTIPSNTCYKHIGRRAKFPDSYKMNESGLFLRESVLDVPQVENLFVTPRSFNYYMTRKSSEEWEKEQAKDNNSRPPINIQAIENGTLCTDLNRMLYYESGKYDYRKLTDIELCTEMDNISRTRFNKHSVYQLSLPEKQILAEEYYRKHHLSESQIRRCLVFPK